MALGRTASILVALALGSCVAEPPTPEGLDPTFYRSCRDDLGLNDRACATVDSWRLPSSLPPARGNAYADDVRAAELGRSLFFDSALGSVADVSCSTCHLPDRAFQDDLATSEVIEGSPGRRNSPSLLDVGWNDGFFFWDGRADSLWSQPLFALENDIEMGGSRLALAHRLHDEPSYRSAYEEIFGALPPLDDATRFPLSGRPGDASWDGMSVADQDAVNRVAANAGKALEAYMRRIASGPSALDRYIDGDRDALSPDARRGLVRFYASGCTACHDGPRLTDGSFHAREMSTSPDRGRAEGIETLLSSPFNSEGDYFDHDAGEALPLPLGPTEEDEHAFRTPTLRNVVLTAPYLHDGSRTLDAILSTPGLLYEPGDEVVIAAFLAALTGDAPPSEWTTPR